MRTRAVVLAGACVALACGDSLERFEYRSRKMGTEARIVLYAPSEVIAERATRAAFARMEQLDSLLSDFRSTSEVSRLAAAPAGVPQPISPDFVTVLRASLTLSAETNGAFDVTIGPVVKLWRAARARGDVPMPAQICAAMKSVGWRHVALDSAARTVRFAVSGMQLDFGGIGKGFAADEAIAVLRAHGIERAMIVWGGEIVAGGAPPGTAGWPVRVDGADVMLEHSAISTSGDAEQFVEEAGVRYSHVIDPRTGEAVTVPGSVTVRAATGMEADGNSTARSVARSEMGRRPLRCGAAASADAGRDVLFR
jgi:thiamine biosynthesis lipoprotein